VGAVARPGPRHGFRPGLDRVARDTVIIGLALTTTALGPSCRCCATPGCSDAVRSFFLAVGTVGEFGPIVAVALLLTKKDPRLTTLLLLIFVAVAVATALLATRPQPPRVVSILRRNLHSSAQLPVRVSLLLILLLVYLAYQLGLDVLLGAFAAGIVVRLFTEGSKAQSCAASSKPSGTGSWSRSSSS